MHYFPFGSQGSDAQKLYIWNQILKFYSLMCLSLISLKIFKNQAKAFGKSPFRQLAENKPGL